MADLNGGGPHDMAATMTKYTPIESEFGDEAEADAHDAWVRLKVERALASTKPRIPHDEAMAWIEDRMKKRDAATRLDD